MTDRPPTSDMRAQDREDHVLHSSNVARPAAAHGHPGAVALPGEPEGPIGTPELAAGDREQLAAAHEAGVTPKARSQWAYARIRFFRHRLAVVSLVVLILIGLVALFAKQVAPYSAEYIPIADPDAIIENPNLIAETLNKPPQLEGNHFFGTDNLGRDYLSRVIFGLRTSLWVALFVALLSTAIGTAVGAVAGYYGGVTDNLLMRFTDLILTLPGLAVLLTAAAFLGQDDSQIGPVRVSQTIKVGLILAFLFWTALARIVRGTFLSLREK